MNKRLEKEIGQRIAEKRGLKWALTSFAFEVWGETENELCQGHLANDSNKHQAKQETK
jgi:hypothetical protein